MPELITSSWRNSVSGTTFGENKANIDILHKSLKAMMERTGRTDMPHFALILVPDPDNRYDPKAIKIFYKAQLYGNKQIGHISARRYCPLCNRQKQGNGYPGYGREVLENCPVCDAPLMGADNVTMQPMLLNKLAVVKASGFFVGSTADKKNLGIIYEVSINIPQQAEEAPDPVPEPPQVSGRYVPPHTQSVTQHQDVAPINYTEQEYTPLEYDTEF